MSIFLRSQKMGLAALIFSVSILLSRVIGLLRDKIISWNFGSGSETDIYFIAFLIPDIIAFILAGGYFSVTLIPLMNERFQQSQEEGWKFFSSAFWFISLASWGFTVIAFIFAPELTSYITPKTFSPEAQQRLTLFMRVVLPAQGFLLPGSCIIALLYMRKQFLVPALSPLFYNLFIILGGLLGVNYGMLGFCIGVPVGAAIGTFLLPYLAAHKGGGIHLKPILFDKDLKRFILLALPLILGQAFMALDEQFIRYFGNMIGEGAVSTLNYARRLTLVPVAMIGQAAGVASFPFLAALIAEKKFAEFDQTLHIALKAAITAIIPFTLLMFIGAFDIVTLIFQGGQFTVENTRTTTLLLRVMLISVPIWILLQSLLRAFYAYKNTFTPMLLGIVTGCLILPLYFLAAQAQTFLPTLYSSLAELFAQTSFLNTPGMVNTALVAACGGIAIVFNTGLLVFFLKTKYNSQCLIGIPLHSLQCLVICILPTLVALAGKHVTHPYLPYNPFIKAFCTLAITGILFVGIFTILCHFFKPDLLPPQLYKIFKKIIKS